MRALLDLVDACPRRPLPGGQTVGGERRPPPVVHRGACRFISRFGGGGRAPDGRPPSPQQAWSNEAGGARARGGRAQPFALHTLAGGSALTRSRIQAASGPRYPVTAVFSVLDCRTIGPPRNLDTNASRPGSSSWCRGPRLSSAFSPISAIGIPGRLDVQPGTKLLLCPCLSRILPVRPREGRRPRRARRTR